MTRLYLDSSAVAKRYLSERGTGWIRALTAHSAGNTIILAEITQVEVAAAVAARQRAGGISRRERDTVVDLLARHCDTEYDLIATNPLVLDHAIRLTQQHRLRAYDALQLATALTANAALVAAGQTGLTFVAADVDLLVAARSEGLPAEDPNHYP